MSNTGTSKPSGASPMRDSNIELFRILSMLLIVAHHYVVNSGLTAGPLYEAPMAPAALFLAVWGAFGKIGINCFVLITGYFMCRSRISAKKLAKLLFALMFYRVVINAIFWLSGYAPFSLREFVAAMIPFTKVAQNFTGTFILFFLCIPFLNVLIHHLTQRQHIRLLLLCTFIYVFFGTLPFFSVTMNYVSWYIVLYFTAAYLRLYPLPLFENVKVWGLCTAGCFLLCCASVVLGSLARAKLGLNLTYFFVTDCNTLLAYVTGICAFLFFKNLRIKPSRLINAVSATTFGVLMIHANSDTMRRWLWQDTLHNVEVFQQHTAWVFPHAVGSVLAVFTLCALMELARIRWIERPVFALWDRHFPAVAAGYAAFEDRLFRRLQADGHREDAP